MVKAELIKQKDLTALDCLNSTVERLMKETDVTDPMERQIREMMAPRNLIEELCLIGLQEGAAVTNGGDSKKTSNFLKLANEMMSARYDLKI